MLEATNLSSCRAPAKDSRTNTIHLMCLYASVQKKTCDVSKISLKFHTHTHTHTHTHIHTHMHMHTRTHAHTHFNNFNRIKSLHNKARNACTRPHHLPKQVQHVQNTKISLIPYHTSSHKKFIHAVSPSRTHSDAVYLYAHGPSFSLPPHSLSLSHTHTHTHGWACMQSVRNSLKRKKAYLLFLKLSCWGLCCEQLFLLLVPLPRIQAQPDLVLRISGVYRDESFFSPFVSLFDSVSKHASFHSTAAPAFYPLQTLWQFRKHYDFEGTGEQKVWTPLNMTSDEALS